MTDAAPSLRDIALAASDRHGGVRGRALGRAAEQAGVKIVYTTIDKIIAGTYRSRPTRATLEALAELANVPVAEVYAAANEPLPGPPFAEELPADVDLLTPPQRRAVLNLIRTFLGDLEVIRSVVPDYVWQDGQVVHLAEVKTLPAASRKPGRKGSMADDPDDVGGGA